MKTAPPPADVLTAAKRPSHGVALAFLLAHLAPLGAIWVGVSVEAVVTCVVLYVVRMWAITAGYHRYFAHRSFKTSRAFAFVLAFVAQSSAQKGALWWAAHHRVHHKLSDKPGDVHSPVLRSFWFAHVGWLFADTEGTRWEKIPDLAKFPELVWLNRYFLLPPVVLGLAVFALFGWSGLFIGFFLSTVLTWHGTFLINSLTHVWGRQRFDAGDQSRNNALTALITLGEGWHNNHHYYQSSARSGFYWWELDVTFYVLKLLSVFGVVWGLRPVPARVLEQGRRLERRPLWRAEESRRASAARGGSARRGDARASSRRDGPVMAVLPPVNSGDFKAVGAPERRPLWRAEESRRASAARGGSARRGDARASSRRDGSVMAVLPPVNSGDSKAVGAVDAARRAFRRPSGGATTAEAASLVAPPPMNA